MFEEGVDLVFGVFGVCCDREACGVLVEAPAADDWVGTDGLLDIFGNGVP